MIWVMSETELNAFSCNLIIACDDVIQDSEIELSNKKLYFVVLNSELNHSAVNSIIGYKKLITYSVTTL